MTRTASTARLASLDHRYLWHPFTQMQEWTAADPLIIQRGKGPYVYDTEGRRYLDGTSSIWVNVHGHRHREIDAAIRRQLRHIAHSTLLGLSSPPSIHLANELVRLAPKGLTRVFYSDNGSTAVEVALKMALQYWAQRTPARRRKQRFIHLSHAYHGDTIGGMSVSGVARFQRPFHAMVFQSHEIPQPHCYRCPLGQTYPDCKTACLDPLEYLLKRQHRNIAGVVIEPMVQAVAGLVPSPPGYLRRVRDLCTKYDVLLIADEVATGFGRTGRMFACEHEDVSPDLMAIAKGLTGGYLPLAATLTRECVYEAFLGTYEQQKTFFHGHSYTGNALGCAAALANLEIFRKEQTLRNLKKKIQFLARALETLRACSIVGDIRQCGLMVGIELVRDKKSRRPFSIATRMGHRVAMECQRNGLLIRPIGDVLVLLPPLSSTNYHVSRMIRILQRALQRVTP